MSDNWPFDLPDYTPERGQLLLVGVMYEGPWERLSIWLLAIDWRIRSSAASVDLGVGG